MIYMKKTTKILSFLLVIIVGGYFMIRNKEDDIKTVRKPHCIVNGNVYLAYDSRYYDSELPQEYVFYGTINQKVEGYETSTNDLTTNASVYYKKDIFINRNDNYAIYVKIEENKYLKLFIEAT